MKKLIPMLVMLLIGCGGHNENIDKNLDYVKSGLGELLIRSPSVNGGTTERNNDDWYFESHTNIDCIGELKGPCRKADVVAQEGVTVFGRIVKYSFVLNVVEYPIVDSPDFVIIFQDWVRIIDGLSNHPVTTLKLKNFDGLSLCSYNNSWQFEWAKTDWGHVSDGSIHDHPSEDLNGCVKIDIGVNHEIEFYIYDSGRVKLLVDNRLIFDKLYQTKSPAKEHIFSWGLYWNKGYNIGFDPLQRVIVTMDDFTRSLATM